MTRFIEEDTIYKVLPEINDASAKEKQGGARPPFWEMVFWWTRKPLIGARCVIAASLLPAGAGEEEFLRNMRLRGVKKTPHNYNPEIPPSWDSYFKGKKMLDPFAGFGSIPLEGARLGLDVTASELLPTAYIFLKAVLEYPAKYGRKLVEDVEKWGQWITEQLKNDPDIKELYDDDVAVYIGTWEVKCPTCGRWTPLIGNHWLARVKDNKGKYKRLAFMKPIADGDEVRIDIVDINRLVKDRKIKLPKEDISEYAKVSGQKITLEKDGKIYFSENVPESNIHPRRSTAICLLCGNPIRFVDENGEHHVEGKNMEWYVKWALKKYHEGDERFARQRLLVKVKVVDGDLIFEPCTEEDNAKLERAKERVRELMERGDSDIPREEISPYEMRSIWVLAYGFNKWYHLFNPRQLLTLVKLVKLIREVGKKVEEEKIREGWSEEDSFAYAEAVATYLSVGLCKFADFNSVSNRWNPGWLKFEETLSVRGIAMMWSWVDTNPFAGFTGTYSRSLENSLGSLQYLTSKFSPQTQQRITDIENNSKEIKVIQDDATTLSKLNDEKYDIIVTDPPYADDVPYTELSDFYYVWLKRALSDSDGRKLLPRFHKEAFFKPFGRAWREIKTQWQEFAIREVSTNPGRFMNEDDRNRKAEQHFRNLLTQSFITMAKHLKDDGIIATYYAHTSPEAWAALLDAGWKGAKLRVTNAIPLLTESAQRVVGRGKLALDTSIVVVWRKGVEGEKEINEIKDDVVIAATKRTLHLLKYINEGHYDLKGRDIMVGAMASSLSIVTQYERILGPMGEIDTNTLLLNYIYPYTVRGMIAALTETFNIPEIRNPYASYYLVVKAFFGATSNGKKFERFKPTADDLRILGIALGIDAKYLLEYNLVKKLKKSGKEYILLEPEKKEPSYLEEYLQFERGIVPSEPELRNPVDALHLLEYWARTLPQSHFNEKLSHLKTLNLQYVEEAINLAKILSKVLKDYDPEKHLASELVAKVKGEKLEVL